MANSLADSIIASWSSGATNALTALAPVLPVPPIKPPGLPPITGSEFSEPEPVIKFPGLDAMKERILNSEVISPARYYGMNQQARQSAFTISGELETKTINRVRDLLYNNVQEGPSLKKFTDLIEKELPNLPLSEARLENVFRTNVLSAYSDANDATLQSPIVADAFPYRAYFATQDGRVRSSHEILESSGLDGTNIYLADDPAWSAIRPPNDFNCRCRWIPQTIRQAARKGVKHAQEWLAAINYAKEQETYTGDDSNYRPPMQFVRLPESFKPSPKFRG